MKNKFVRYLIGNLIGIVTTILISFAVYVITELPLVILIPSAVVLYLLLSILVDFLLKKLQITIKPKESLMPDNKQHKYNEKAKFYQSGDKEKE